MRPNQLKGGFGVNDYRVFTRRDDLARNRDRYFIVIRGVPFPRCTGYFNRAFGSPFAGAMLAAIGRVCDRFSDVDFYVGGLYWAPCDDVGNWQGSHAVNNVFGD